VQKPDDPFRTLMVCFIQMLNNVVYLGLAIYHAWILLFTLKASSHHFHLVHLLKMCIDSPRSVVLSTPLLSIPPDVSRALLTNGAPNITPFLPVLVPKHWHRDDL